MKLKKSVMLSILVFSLTFMAIPAFARTEIVDLELLSKVAIPLHVIELVLSLFICFMALQFFRITKPINLFLFIYVAIGFFVINSLLNLIFFLMQDRMNTSFVNVHIGSRIALIGMVLSFVMFFYNWNKIMRKPDARNK